MDPLQTNFSQSPRLTANIFGVTQRTVMISGEENPICDIIIASSLQPLGPYDPFPSCIRPAPNCPDPWAPWIFRTAVCCCGGFRAGLHRALHAAGQLPERGQHHDHGHGLCPQRRRSHPGRDRLYPQRHGGRLYAGCELRRSRPAALRLPAGRHHDRHGRYLHPQQCPGRHRHPVGGAIRPLAPPGHHSGYNRLRQHGLQHPLCPDPQRRRHSQDRRGHRLR